MLGGVRPVFGAVKVRLRIFNLLKCWDPSESTLYRKAAKRPFLITVGRKALKQTYCNRHFRLQLTDDLLANIKLLTNTYTELHGKLPFESSFLCKSNI